MHTNQLASLVRPAFDADAFLDVAFECNVSNATALKAREQLLKGTSCLLAISGWQGSGKDTVAPALFSATGRPDACHLYYANSLKDEVDEVFSTIRRAGSVPTAVAGLIEQFSASTEAAERMVSIIGDALWAPGGESLQSRDRTEQIRDALQFWGTDFRRAQDTDYWVNLALGPAIDTIAEGHDAYFSDVRFKNEVDGCQRIGFFVVRLEINEVTQRDRLIGRDGFVPGPEKLSHVSEHDLDGYENFDLVVDNNGTVDRAVAEIIEAMGITRKDVAS